MGGQLFSSSHWFILTTKELFYNLFIALTGTYHWYQSKVTMTTNKERIENLEAGLVGVQGGFQRMEMDVGNKLHQLEEAISKLSEILRANKGPVGNTNQF